MVADACGDAEVGGDTAVAGRLQRARYAGTAEIRNRFIRHPPLALGAFGARAQSGRQLLGMIHQHATLARRVA